MTSILTSSKNDPYVFCSTLHGLSNAVYRFSMRCVVLEISGGGGLKSTPPPVLGWLRPPPVRGLKVTKYLMTASLIFFFVYGRISFKNTHTWRCITQRLTHFRDIEFGSHRSSSRSRKVYLRRVFSSFTNRFRSKSHCKRMRPWAMLRFVCDFEIGR